MVRQGADHSRPHAVEDDEDAALGLDCVSRDVQRTRSEGGDPGQEGNVPPGQVVPKDAKALRAVGESAHEVDQPAPGGCDKRAASGPGTMASRAGSGTPAPGRWASSRPKGGTARRTCGTRRDWVQLNHDDHALDDDNFDGDDEQIDTLKERLNACRRAAAAVNRDLERFSRKGKPSEHRFQLSGCQRCCSTRP